MDERLRKEEEIFTEACRLATDQRAAFLARACAGDADLLQRVTALLRAAAGPRGILEIPLVVPRDPCAGGGEDLSLLGHTVGPYRIVRKLGEGGAGVVYEAEQAEPLRRRVALKLIRPSVETEVAVARFEAERQALAMMEHPCIAHVHDAGATDDGRLYFAMELVEGMRITEYCDRHRLPTHARLALFGQVCRAVQHAHQKGVIHRDIKPSNILVAEVDGTPLPKIIDFGIAKATRHGPGEACELTMLGQAVGTPAYMSPEQAAAASADIDTRTDIYSLGVLLYELLTGLTPFEMRELARAGLDAVQRVLREREPPRPSERLRTTRAGDLAEIARRRDADPATLIRMMRGDLDWVVLKAMERDRERRYATPMELVADVERHLHREPVTARAPSTAYRLRKFIQRHRLGVAAGASAFAMLAVIAVVSTILAVRATRAERRAQEVVAVFNELLEGIGQTATLGPPSNLERSAREWNRLLDQTERRVTSRPMRDPVVAAEVRRVFGKIYMATGRHAEAKQMFGEAMRIREAHNGPDDPEALESRYDMGFAAWHLGPIDEGTALISQVVEARRRTLGPDHPDTVRVLEMLGFGLWVQGDAVHAEPLLRAAVESRERTGRLADYDNHQFSAANGYAMCLLTLGRNEEGLRYAELDLKTLMAAPAPPRRFLGRANLTMAWALKALGRNPEDLPYARQAVACDLRDLGPDHPELSFPIYDLGNALAYSGNPDDAAEAEQCYRQCVAIWRATRAADTPTNLVGYLTTLAEFLILRGRGAEAVPLVDEAWTLVETVRLPNVVANKARVIHAGIGAHRGGAGRAEAWERRLADFEEELGLMPHDTYRTCAIRGLAEVMADWAKEDPTRAESARRWQEERTRAEEEQRSLPLAAR
ncbi:MAG: serine/threonine protein kinase [Opitutaceae bacterium]|nr:serine/threonine protein kinase [Opitutaceae bacterium]